MSIGKFFSTAILFTTVLSAFVFSQTPVKVNEKQSSNFVSIEGEFTIALPQNVTEYGPLKMPDARVKGGSKYGWNKPQGAFFISFVDYLSFPANPETMMEFMVKGFVATVTGKGAKIILKKDLSLDGYSGVEIRFVLDGQTISNRYYLVRNRFYSLTSAWKESANGESELKILDSFKLIDGTAALAKMVEDAAPKPLPQSPVGKKSKTDAEDDRLKGKVKTVLTTSEDLTGNWVVSGIKKSTEVFYDEIGFKTKFISYDYKGFPRSIAVYGFIDGMRVSSSGELRYEYDPPLMMMAKPTGSKEVKPPPVVKPFDSRYGTKYEYKYNDKGQLEEAVRFLSNGDLANKTVYAYDGNKVEISSSAKDGKVYSKSIEVYDEKSNLIEKTYVSTNPKIPDSKYTYSYAEFDENGNWTKRIVFGKDGNFDGTYKEQHYNEYRTVNYYP